MHKLCLSLLTLVVLVATGCDGKSPPGGPGATGTASGTARGTGITLGQPDNTFSLDVPNLETDLKQGEKKTITIGIVRGKNFDQDVKLDFGDAPPGVKVSAVSQEIKAGEKNVQVTLEVAKDAALGEHQITVTGTPAREGAKTSAKFQIEVKKPE